MQGPVSRKLPVARAVGEGSGSGALVRCWTLRLPVVGSLSLWCDGLDDGPFGWKWTVLSGALLGSLVAGELLSLLVRWSYWWTLWCNGLVGGLCGVLVCV